MDNGIPEQKRVNEHLYTLAQELGLKTVATNDIHYLNKADAANHDVLLCIQTGETLDDTKRLKFKTDEFYFRSPEEMQKLFSDYPESLETTIEIAEKCNLSLELGKFHLPNFPLPEGHTAETYIKSLAEEGLKERYSQITDTIDKRATMELAVIRKMVFSTYFLIVWDFIRFAKSIGITIGPGRGSAAGSIVAYALGITSVDPLRYGLIFERFLNESRISMPDIDVDFDGDRKDEVIEGVKLFAERIATPEDYKKNGVSQLHLLLKDKNDESRLLRLQDILIQHKGKCDVYIHLPKLDKKRQTIHASTFLLVSLEGTLLTTLKAEQLVEKVWIV